MAHVFHNCRRRSAGLKETPTKQGLLDIDYVRREEFAYACEAYSRILEQAKTPSERHVLAALFKGFMVNDKRVDNERVAEIVRTACHRRNGWKTILDHCQKSR